MKGKIAKIISICLCMTLLTGGAMYAFASNDNDKDKNVDITQNDTDKQQDEAAGNSNISKDETVYVLANADGSVQKIIVSDWIKNVLSSDKINDVTELKNTQNIKGDEEYVLGGDNSRVWDAQGKDIYYQGTIEKELPVDISVSYTLDGQTISPDELAGKSGKVTIRFDYRNKQYETVKINGKNETIYVPYLMLTGMILDNDSYSNITVSNGKIINDGSRTAVIGFALPGLAESLDIDQDKLEIPSYVELTADVNDFSLGMTITLATNTLFNQVDPDNIDTLSTLKDSMTKLDDAMTKLLDGSSELYNGLSTLLNKSSELVSGIDQLADGASKLKDGANSLDHGAKQLSDGAVAVSEGLNTLSANNDRLNDGAKKVFETLLATATNELKKAGLTVPDLTVDNYATVLNKVIASLDESKFYNQALEQVTTAVEAKRDYIKSQVVAAVQVEVEENVKSAVMEQVKAQVTEAVKAEVAKKVPASYVDTQMKSDEVAAMITQKVNEQMETEQIKNLIKSNSDKKMEDSEIQSLIEEKTEQQIQKTISEKLASEEVQAQLSAASEGAKSVISLKASLDDYNTFYLGIKDYTSAVAQAAGGAADLSKGAGKLKNGADDLYDGVCSLYDGILTMKNGAPALVDGITKLKDGSMQLSDGLSRFSEEGVQKLLDLADDGEILMDRFKAIVNVSKNYKSFAGISDDADGNVKFIYRTDEIKQN